MYIHDHFLYAEFFPVSAGSKNCILTEKVNEGFLKKDAYFFFFLKTKFLLISFCRENEYNKNSYGNCTEIECFWKKNIYFNFNVEYVLEHNNFNKKGI